MRPYKGYSGTIEFDEDDLIFHGRVTGIRDIVTFEADSAAGYSLAIIVGVNSVIALFYYARVAKTMIMDDVPDGDLSPVQVPVSLRAAISITLVLTVVFGILPQLVAGLTDNATLLSAVAVP